MPKDISKISFDLVKLSDAITRPSDTTAYAAGDAISEVTTNDHFTFGVDYTASGKQNGSASIPGANTGMINTARIISSANQSTKLHCELWLFQSDIAEVADNAAFAPSDTEMQTLIGIVEFASQQWIVGKSDAGADGNAVCEIRNIDLPYADNGKGQIFGQLVARNAYTPVSGEIFTVQLLVTRDA